jgi:cytochrome c
MLLSRIVLSFATSAFVMTAGSALAQDAAKGETLFKQRCAACHSVEAGQNKMGPHLMGVVGRAAGSVEGAKYSKALPASGLTWDEANLDSYLGNPKKTVPGTTMAVSLTNAAQRADVIAYLKTLQ